MYLNGRLSPEFTHVNLTKARLVEMNELPEASGTLQQSSFPLLGFLPQQAAVMSAVH